MINVSKCLFGKPTVDFLGHNVDNTGIRPTKDRVQAIIDYKQPKNVKDLRRFLGMINFYRRFIPNASQHQAVLTEYLKGSTKNDRRKIDWTKEAVFAFNTAKDQLSDATTLVFPVPNAPLCLMTDASDFAIGGVVQQLVNNEWQPLGFFSAKLNSAQKNYGTYDRELLAAYSSIKHFRFFLEGRTFTLFTDQKPLIHAFHQRSEKTTPRQLRHLDFIGQFTTDIKHISGKDNVVADALSRIEKISISETVNYETVAMDQIDDEELKRLRRPD